MRVDVASSHETLAVLPINGDEERLCQSVFLTNFALENHRDTKL